LFLCAAPLWATDRYISSSTGSDVTGDGTIGAPWQSLYKVTTATVASGDNILLKRGDVFVLVDSFIVPRSNLHFNAYGTGAKPLIHSLKAITGWVSVGGNIWEATNNEPDDLNLVLRNGTIQQVGRFPNANAANAGYLINTAVTSTSLTGPALSTTTNWTGAQAAIRTNHWTVTKRTVLSHSGGTITFDAITAPKKGFGYFFQRDARTLDQDGEWFQKAGKLRMYFSNNNPSAYLVQVPAVDTLLYTAQAGTTFTNLAFTGCDKGAIVARGVSGIIIEDCDVTKSGMDGFEIGFCTNSTIQRSTADSCLNSGIVNRGSAGTEGARPTVNLLVQDCFVNHTSPIAGMESNGEHTGYGLRCSGGTGVTILRNVVKNSGYVGIEWYGDNVLVQNNLVDTFCTVRDDGGGIYSWETAAGNNPWIRFNRVIDGNIVLNGIGQSKGTPSSSESSNVGIYVDDNTRNVIISYNTIAWVNGNGIHGNGNDTNSIVHNTIYKCGNSISMQRLNNESEIRGMVITDNILYPYRFRYRNLTIDLPTLLTKEQDVLAMGTLNNNYHSTRPGADTSWWAVTTFSAGTNYSETHNSFPVLQSTGQEAGSLFEANNNGVLEYNASGSPKVVSFSGANRDVYGNIYVGSVTIPPWRSVILIPQPATNYYVSAAGNDANSGLTPATPWKTIYKVSAGTYIPGDKIFFRSGDQFIGKLVIRGGGTISSPITIGSYNTGAKPVLTGMVSLSGWANVSGNIWQATPDSTLQASVNILTIGGIPQAVGRTPWMVYQSATATQLTSSSISGTFTGAEIVMRKTSETAERATVTAQAGTTVTYNRTAPGLENSSPAPLIAGTPGYGFFFQRFAGSLDSQGEWYFNQSTNKMQLYSTSNPSGLNVRASYADVVVDIAGTQNVVLDGLAIEGGGLYGVSAVGGTNVQVRNCSFSGNTKAVYMWNTSDALVLSNSFNHSLNGAVFISNPVGRRITVHSNTVTSTGQLIGNGVFNSPAQLKGIVALVETVATSTYVNVLNNTVTNTGSTAIQFQGYNAAVRANTVDGFANVTDNTGGILSVVNNNTVAYTGRVLDSNFVSNGTGAINGAPAISVKGIFLADQSRSITARHNTVYNIPGPGIQLDNPNNITLQDNNVYNTTYAYKLVNNPVGQGSNNHITLNQFYQKNDLQYIGYYSNSNLSLPPPGTTIKDAITGVAEIDANYISNQKFDSYHYDYSPTGGSYTFPPDLTLGQWKTTYGHEINSVPPPTVVTPTNTVLEVNPSYTPKVISFPGLSKVTPKGQVYNNTLTLPAYTSEILIDNSPIVVPNQPPTASAGADQAITLPVNSVTLTGSGTDPDGSIISYAWVQLTGPGTATIASPSSASTIVNNLSLTGIYEFQLTVRDNSGATATSVVKVTVNASPNIPPTVNAGTDITITLPVNSTTLTATPADADGTIIDITWSKYTGGSGGNITTPKAASTLVTGLQQGTYQYRVVVTDNKGGSAQDIVQVTVLAPVIPNQPPTANAGPDIQVVLPTTSTVLGGSASDVDGTFTVQWTRLSGGTGGDLSATNIVNPTVSNLQEGIYTWQLTVTDDDGAISTDVVTVTVYPAIIPNTIPVVTMNPDVEITLPVNSATIEGYGVDVEDIILTYQWTKLSGPVSGAITTPASNITTVTGLVQGTYVYQLSATDSEGATGTNVIQVVVKPAVVINQPPVVTVTADKTTLTLPENSTTLRATATDNDGNIALVAWQKTSGPAGTIVSPGNLITAITGLQVGTYTFQVTVTDNGGASTIRTIQIFRPSYLISLR
jgi:parallel beta-helix repeat protein